MTLLSVEDVSVSFDRKGSAERLVAVSHVTVEISEGETLGLVGESGCGKSTLARCILGLIRPVGGRVLFRGSDINTLERDAKKQFYREVQIVFQDPYASLNPRLTILESVAEGLKIHRLIRTRREIQDRVVEVLERVGLGAEHLHRYPKAFSGGQRQRIAIARALAVRPSLLICDEPVTALDASVRAQVLNLLVDLQRTLKLAMLFISHDLSVIHHVADRVAVMKEGKLLEISRSEDLFQQPKDEYTKQLLITTPVADPVTERARRIARHTALTGTPV